MSKQISTKTTIRNLTAEIKKTFVKKDAFTPVQTAANAAIKSLGVDGNTVNFYTSTDKSGTAAFSVDFPSELFLDQTKTTFVAKFKFDAATYPGATDPKLDGKPVMVLAVKGENPDSCTYSFLSMAALVDTYKAKAVGKDASTTVTIAGYEVDVKVNVSAAAGNALTLKDDGLYVPTPEEVDISGKADKVTGATTGNLAALDGEGNLTDSGKKPADFVGAEAGKRLMTDAEGEKLAGVSEGATKTAASSTNGNVNIDGKEVVVYTEPENVLHDEDVEDFSAEEIAALLADGLRHEEVSSMAKAKVKTLLGTGLAALCSHIKQCNTALGDLSEATANGFEETDDILHEKQDVTAAVSFTIPVDGWGEDDSSPGYFCCDIPIAGLLATDIVDVTVLPGFYDVAGAVGFIATESLEGKLRLRAAKAPTEKISAQYHITSTVKYTAAQEGGT